MGLERSRSGTRSPRSGSCTCSRLVSAFVFPTRRCSRSRPSRRSSSSSVSASTAPDALLRGRSLRFTTHDLEEFAAASGDRNPLHLDASFARRSPFGVCIVHGSLVALALLGTLPEGVLPTVRSLQATFGAPVLVDEALVAEARPGKRPGSWEVRLTGRGRLLTRVAASATPTAGPVVEPVRPADPGPMRAEPFVSAADVPGAGYEVAGVYRPGAELAALGQRWNVETLDPALLEGLAWVSYVVGMELPGLHGLFAA